MAELQCPQNPVLLPTAPGPPPSGALRKLLVVRSIMDQIAAEKQAVQDDHREEGAHTTVKRYYRAYKLRKNLAKLVYWSRFDKAITYRNISAGTRAARGPLLCGVSKRAKEKRVFDAAACMQRYVRGVNARKLYAGLVHEKRKEVARKRMRKKEYLENHAINAGRAVLLALRKMMPFRYIPPGARLCVFREYGAVTACANVCTS